MNRRRLFVLFPLLLAITLAGISSLPHVHAGPGNFTVQATSPVIIPSGGGGSSTVRINATGGFTGTITVTTTMPVGLTIGCAPGMVTIGGTNGNGTSTCTITSSTPGNYLITISGSNGTAGAPNVVTHSVNVAVTVLSFTSSLTPANIAFNSGKNANETLTLVNSGFNETVTLASSSVPATGLSVLFTPSTVVLNTKTAPTATSLVTFRSSVPNVYNVTVTGTSNVAGHPAVTVNTIVNVQGYTLSASPNTIVHQSWFDSPSSTISLSALPGFSGNVNLTIQPFPGFTGSFSFPTVLLKAGGSNSSVLSLSLGTPSPGNATIVVVGSSTLSSGTLVNTANIIVQVVGKVCLADPSAASSSFTCPSSPYVFSGPGPAFAGGQLAATQLRVGVFAQGTGRTNQVDITLLTDNSVLTPDHIDLTGSILPGARTVVVCENGLLISGNVCAHTDVQGTVHVSVQSAPGTFSSDGATGLIFTVTYNIVAQTSGNVTIGFQTGCSATSIVGGTLCITVQSGSTKPVPENPETAVFTNAHIPSSPCAAGATPPCLGDPASYPYVAVTSSAASVSVPKGASAGNGVTITVTAENGWPVGSTDLITFSATASGGFTPPSLSATTCATSGISCSITANMVTATGGTYTATIFGLYVATDLNGTLAGTGLTNTLVAPVTISVNIEDAAWTINGVPTGETGQQIQNFLMARNNTATGGPSNPMQLVYTVQSLGGFTGTITYSTAIGGAGLKFVYPAPFTLSPGQTITKLVNVTTITADANKAGAKVQWEPKMTAGATPKTGAIDNIFVDGFSTAAASTSLSFTSGGSTTDSVSLASLGGTVDGFFGNVTLAAASTPSTGLMVTCPVVTLARAGTGSSMCIFASVTQGVYSVVIRGVGSGCVVAGNGCFNNGVTNSTATITVTVSGDFTIGASPTTVSVTGLGGKDNSTITVTAVNGLSGSVSLSQIVNSSGLVCIFVPTSVSLSGSSTLSCVPSFTGAYLVTVTGSFGGADGLILSHNVNVTYIVTAGKATPTVTTTPSSSSITVGSSVSDSATVSGGSSPTGTVTFSVFSGGVCSGTPYATKTVSLVGTSAGPVSVIFNGTGTFNWQATYNGDTNNNVASSACGSESLTVSPKTTTTSTVLSAASITVGTTASDSATITGFFGGHSAGGTVTYSVFPVGTATCTAGTAIFTQTVDVNSATGAVPSSRAVQFNITGTYQWQASYSGDANNSGSSSTCGSEALIVNKTTTSMISALTSPTITVGTTTIDNSSILGVFGGFSTGGTVTYNAYSGTACTGTPVFTQVVNLSFTSALPASGPVRFNVTGTYEFQAVYSGDANNAGSSTACGSEALTVNKTTTSITTVLSSSGILVGATASDSSSITGFFGGFSTGGTVTYNVFPAGTTTCTTGTAIFSQTVTVNSASGAVPSSRTVQFNATGTYQWQATYSGDTNNAGSSSVCGSEPLNVGVPTVTITTLLSASSISSGGTASDTSTLHSQTASAGGTVTYSVFPAGTTTCAAGTAIFTQTVSVTNGVVPPSRAVQFNATGTYQWQAVYSGDPNNSGATSTCGSESLVVGKTTTTTATILSSASITVGTTATDSSRLTGFFGGFSTGGTVTYSVFPVGTTTCTAGTAIFSQTVSVNSATGAVPNSRAVQFNTTGTYQWQASYSGDANNSGSSSVCGLEALIVSKTTTTTTTSLSTSSISVGLTASDSATLAGFFGSFSTGGTVTYTIFPANTSTCTSGTAIFSQTVSVNPTTGAVPSSRAVQFNATGTYQWQASYSGDGNNGASASVCGSEALSVGVPAVTITTSLSATSITVGTSASDSSTLHGQTATAGGTVMYTVFSGTACTGTVVFTQTVTVTSGVVLSSRAVQFNATGTYQWQAVYSGDPNNGGATSTCGSESLTANKTTTTTNTSPSASSITVGATASDSSSLAGFFGGFSTGGTVTYNAYSGTSCTGTAVFSQTVVVNSATGAVPSSRAVRFNTTGTFEWQAVYSGDNNNGGSLSTCGAESLTVNKTTTSTASSLSTNSVTVGTTASDSSSLTGFFGGFSSGGTVSYNLFPVGTATCTAGTAIFSQTVTINPTTGAVPNSRAVQFNATGTYQWQASYSGDANNSGSSSVCGSESLTVNKTTTTTATSLSATSITAGSTVSDSASLTGFFGGFSSGGTVTYNIFPVGTTTCTAGTAIFTQTVTVNSATGSVPSSRTVQFNASGTYEWQGTYSGDGNNAGSSSTCGAEALSVGVPTVTITTALSVTSITVGTSASDSSTLHSQTATAGGTVTYNVYSGSACTGNLVFSQTVQVTSGVVPSSRSVVFNLTGTYQWQAAYSGDTSNGSASSTCGSEPLSVSPSSTSTSTTLSSSSITVGSTASDSSSITGFFSGFSSGGSVTYSVFPVGTTTCTAGTAIFSQTVAVNSATGAVPNSRAVQLNTTGTYQWQAAYSGDGNNGGSSSVCGSEALAVTDFRITASPTTVIETSGTTGTSTITVTAVNGFNGNVMLSANNHACSVAPTPITGPGTSMLSCTFVPVGVVNVTVTGASGSLSHSAIVTFDVTSTTSAGCGTGCIASVSSDATITNFTGNATLLSFTATGQTGTTAFANITIPRSAIPIISALRVTINGTQVTPTITSNSADYFVSFTFTFHSTFVINVFLSSPTVQPVLLTFSAFDVDDFENGVGQLQVFVNGHLVVDIPAGLNHLTGSGDFTPYANTWVKFGPFNIAQFVTQGQNTIVFLDPLTSHFGLVKNVTIVQGSTVLLRVTRASPVFPGHPTTYTFSIPPLVITSFTSSTPVAVVGQLVTFTATYTGGTAPFTCSFSFGDGESASVSGVNGVCSITHDYDFNGTFRVRVTVKGASTSDVQTARLTIAVLGNSVEDD